MELLTDGKNAFPEIIKNIESATESIFINMFIWRNDSIGNKIAKALLSAADRGIRVAVSKDRYGTVCEMCEENRLSFFNRSPSLTERIKILFLYLTYDKNKSVNIPTETDDGELLSRFLNHPNISVEYNKNKYDHSKFYIFDRKTVILGGINIEDKENGNDFAGRKYRDYMVKISEPESVREFLRSRNFVSDMFPANIKAENISEMKKHYLKIINTAESELTVVMAYFSPLKEFEKAFLRAAERIGKVNIVIPEHANFQNNLNRKTVSRLSRLSGGKIKIYFYPGMLHAKLLMNEKTVSLGSCNITKKAFGQLDELNVSVKNDGSDFARAVRESVGETFTASRLSDGKIRYNSLVAAAESVLV